MADTRVLYIGKKCGPGTTTHPDAAPAAAGPKRPSQTRPKGPSAFERWLNEYRQSVEDSARRGKPTSKVVLDAWDVVNWKRLFYECTGFVDGNDMWARPSKVTSTEVVANMFKLPIIFQATAGSECTTVFRADHDDLYLITFRLETPDCVLTGVLASVISFVVTLLSGCLNGTLREISNEIKATQNPEIHAALCEKFPHLAARLDQ